MGMLLTVHACHPFSVHWVPTFLNGRKQEAFIELTISGHSFSLFALVVLNLP
jgi:hypothetical protein